MTVTGLGLITGALKDLGVLALGQELTGPESDDGLDALNQMADALGLEKLLLYTEDRTVVNLSSGTASYAIGDSATINLPRPDWIDSAGLILDYTVSEPIERPLGLLDDKQYAVWPLKTQQQLYPRAIWYDRGHSASGAARIYVLPIPSQDASQLVLYTPGGALDEFDLSTPVLLPRGWAQMLRLNLAVRLKSMYPQVTLDPMLVRAAADAKSAIKRPGSRVPMQKNDTALVRSVQRFDMDSGELL